MGLKIDRYEILHRPNRKSNFQYKIFVLLSFLIFLDLILDARIAGQGGYIVLENFRKFNNALEISGNFQKFPKFTW